MTTIRCPHCQAEISTSIIYRYIVWICEECGGKYKVIEGDETVKVDG